MRHIYIPNQDYKVLVRCFTYNQRKYIEDALNGFAMQQTEFPFVCLVMDDCSTDGEQEVIKAWMERECDMVKAEYIDIELSNVILVPHKSNTSCTFAFYFLKQNLYGAGKKKMNMVYPWRECCEYEAICEGDDYWIDSYKLQKQVDFLDCNSDYGLCCTANQKRIEENDIITDETSRNGDISFHTLLIGNRISALTALYRTTILKEYYQDIKPLQQGWLMGDYPTWLYFAHRSKIMCLKDVTACYRIVSGSISRQTAIESKFRYIDSVYSVRFFFMDLYNEYQDLKKDMIAEKYYCRAGVYFERKRYRHAIAEIKKCPFNCHQFVKRVAKLILRIPS